MMADMHANLRTKRHWLVGSGFILLFCLLLTFRLGLWEGGTPVPPGAYEAQPSLPARDDWFTISQEGRKIGYAHRTMAPTTAGYDLKEEVLLYINTMGVLQPLHFQTAGNLDPRMSLTAFTFGLNSGLFRFHARGSVKGKLLNLYIGPPGEEKAIEIALKEPLYLSAGVFEVSRFVGLQPGEKRTFHVFDPVAMGERPVTVSRSSVDEVILQGGERKLVTKFALNFMGVTQFAWVDVAGNILREKGILGIVLKKPIRREALAGLDRLGSADLTDLAAIPANRVLENHEELQELQVRLSNLDAAVFSLDGDRQTWSKGVLRIRKKAAPNRQETKITEGNPALQPGPLIQSDHPLIIGKAEEIIAAGDTEEEKARKLMDWVYRQVKKRPVLSVPNALETLTNLVGDCNEHAMLLAALARAAGIPAEVEAGLVYSKGKFYYHAWNALYLKGTWVTADAVLGQMPADVTHIRFVRGAAERQMDLLGLIGRLRLEIIDVL